MTPLIPAIVMTGRVCVAVASVIGGRSFSMLMTFFSLVSVLVAAVRETRLRRGLRRELMNGRAFPPTAAVDDRYFDSLRARARGDELLASFTEWDGDAARDAYSGL